MAELTVARVLLLVPARTYRASDFLVAAGRLGLDLVVGSDGALPLSNRLVIPVDPGEGQASVDRLVARSGPVDAVLAATDKATQRRRWATAGVAQPAFRVVPAGATQDALHDAAARSGSPVWSRRCR